MSGRLLSSARWARLARAYFIILKDQLKARADDDTRAHYLAQFQLD